jgi:hypothetical protein
MTGQWVAQPVPMTYVVGWVGRCSGAQLLQKGATSGRVVDISRANDQE